MDPDAQKHTDPTDPDPKQCLQEVIHIEFLKTNLCTGTTGPRLPILPLLLIHLLFMFNFPHMSKFSAKNRLSINK